MKKSPNTENQKQKSRGETRAELEAALEEEVRMSRRQVLLKKLWKLDQPRSRTSNKSLKKEPLAQQQS